MDDQLKQRLMPAFMVFNLTVGIYLLVRFFLGESMYFSSFTLHLLIGAGIGLVTGGIMFALTPKS